MDRKPGQLGTEGWGIVWFWPYLLIAPVVVTTRIVMTSFLVWLKNLDPHHGSVMRVNGIHLAPHVIPWPVALSRECLSPR